MIDESPEQLYNPTDNDHASVIEHDQLADILDIRMLESRAQERYFGWSYWYRNNKIKHIENLLQVDEDDVYNDHMNAKSAIPFIFCSDNLFNMVTNIKQKQN